MSLVESDLRRLLDAREAVRRRGARWLRGRGSSPLSVSFVGLVLALAALVPARAQEPWRLRTPSVGEPVVTRLRLQDRHEVLERLSGAPLEEHEVEILAAVEWSLVEVEEDRWLLRGLVEEGTLRIVERAPLELATRWGTSIEGLDLVVAGRGDRLSVDVSAAARRRLRERFEKDHVGRRVPPAVRHVLDRGWSERLGRGAALAFAPCSADGLRVERLPVARTDLLDARGAATATVEARGLGVVTTAARHAEARIARWLVERAGARAAGRLDGEGLATWRRDEAEGLTSFRLDVGGGVERLARRPVRESAVADESFERHAISIIVERLPSVEGAPVPGPSSRRWPPDWRSLELTTKERAEVEALRRRAEGSLEALLAEIAAYAELERRSAGRAVERAARHFALVDALARGALGPAVSDQTTEALLRTVEEGDEAIVAVVCRALGHPACRLADFERVRLARAVLEREEPRLARWGGFALGRDLWRGARTALVDALERAEERGPAGARLAASLRLDLERRLGPRARSLPAVALRALEVAGPDASRRPFTRLGSVSADAGTFDLLEAFGERTLIVADLSAADGLEPRNRHARRVASLVAKTLQGLRPGQRFGLVAFDREARELAKRLLEVEPESLRAAERFLEGFSSRTGADLAGALRAAWEIPDHDVMVLVLPRHDAPARALEESILVANYLRATRLVVHLVGPADEVPELRAWLELPERIAESHHGWCRLAD